MSDNYVLGIDQSTQGTKALLFDTEGKIVCRADLSHKQYINETGWVEHDLEEIYQNTIAAVKAVVQESGIDKNTIATVGISNQRETAAAWNRKTGEPVERAIVWQCARGQAICDEIGQKGLQDIIKQTTGLPLSPYFSAAKLSWMMKHVKGLAEESKAGNICCGTIDSWLVYQLTKGKVFQTDYSNASRTQLFHVQKLQWDEEICSIFGIFPKCLPKVCDSNAEYGSTDFEGFLEQPIPIQAVMGDSHAALFGQGCHKAGMVKSTYGTGSSIMMNIGKKPIFTEQGVVTSLAWGVDNEVYYVLEGNINYTGAVISWLQKDLGLILSPADTAELAKMSNPNDKTYLVPAFSGLGAPYWDSNACAVMYGMSRTTGRAEIVKAGLDCIAYQITDIVEIMKQVSGIPILELRVDGGPTKNDYLMQFQSDMLGIPVQVPEAEELSCIGAAYMAGIKQGIYHEDKIFKNRDKVRYESQIEEKVRKQKYKGWKQAVTKSLSQV